MSKQLGPHALRWLPWIALFCAVIGPRLWLISVYGSALPIHDQWEGEAGFLFKPWLENTLRWPDLFAPHNEHRIVLSRLLALGLFQANGQWDPLLEMTVNVPLCGLIGLGIAAGLLKIVGNQFRIPVLVAVTLWLALPYGHENTLWGFQSAFYFLLCFSFLAIWGLGFFPAYSWNWWLGAFGAVLACFSMASGLLAAGVIFILEAIRLLSKQRRFVEAAPTCVFAILIIAVSLYFRVTHPPHEALRATSVQAWWDVFARSLSWPYCEIPILLSVTYLPWAVCTFLMLTNRPAARARHEIVFVLGLWVIIHAAAIAYARGENGNVPIASRYMDILGLGATVNALGVIALVQSAISAGRRSAPAVVLGAIWIVGVVCGAGQLGLQKISAPGKEVLLPMEENVRAYVATHDRKYLAGDRPYADTERLASLLDDPTIRKILPAIVRPVLPLQIRQGTGDAFIANGYPVGVASPPYEKTWGSYSQAGPEARGSMESESIQPELPYVQVTVAGNSRGTPALVLRDGQTGEEERVTSHIRIDENWRAGVVRVPGRAPHIIARDESTEDWIAFREPRELGRLSYYTRQIVSHPQTLFRVGTVLLTAVITAGLLVGFEKDLKDNVTGHRW